MFKSIKAVTGGNKASSFLHSPLNKQHQVAKENLLELNITFISSFDQDDAAQDYQDIPFFLLSGVYNNITPKSRFL